MSAVLKSLSSTEAEAEEWRLRCDMAAVFRVSARLGWNEQIGNHNSLMLPGMLPGATPTFLINPRGWSFGMTGLDVWFGGLRAPTRISPGWFEAHLILQQRLCPSVN